MSNRYLSTALRRALEKTAKDARIVAEDGARDAIRRLGVSDSKAPTHLGDDEKDLRRRLRAHARALGDAFEKADDTQETKRLVEAAAYAHWHRMLFARFLAERGLLRNPEYDVPVSLEDCRELAEAEGLTDAWAIAERYAASMLPAVFRVNDPVLALDLDPVHIQTLNRLVTGLDAEVFQAEDSLGWTYQFWRSAEKDAVNASGVKIGADELPAVTQLFTEPYMVRFLLHNTLGAWWAGKVLDDNPALARAAVDEDALRAACSLQDYDFDMLRFVREGEVGPWRPAAGTFPCWPKEAKAITVLDPCCGSGHFLTEALAILTALRQTEEQQPSGETVAAVLRDNLHGLEIDGRCVQIAAFAVAMSGWRIGGWQTLPIPHIAWVGAPPPLPKREFVALADGATDLEYALAALHDLFAQAPVLGSLIHPTRQDLFEAEKMNEVERLLDILLEKTRKLEPNQEVGTVAARGMADAAKMLSQKFHLIATNFPFLGLEKQNTELSEQISLRFPDCKRDIAVSFIDRSKEFTASGSVVAFVGPSEWTFSRPYRDFRPRFLSERTVLLMSRLGRDSFTTKLRVNPVLAVIETGLREVPSSIVDVRNTKFDDLFSALTSREIDLEHSRDWLSSPDSRIMPPATSEVTTRLEDFAEAKTGMTAGDGDHFERSFWEIKFPSRDWDFLQSSPTKNEKFSGRSKVIFWQQEKGEIVALAESVKHLNHSAQNWQRGRGCWGKKGVVLSKYGIAGIYSGDKFDNSCLVIVPKYDRDLIGIVEFFISGKFSDELLEIDDGMAIAAPKTILSVPFDSSASREQVATDEIEITPTTEDPANWLFTGHPASGVAGTRLHVALARLCGYKWPSETYDRAHLAEEAHKTADLPPGDNDGLLGVPPVAGEMSLAERLRVYLAATFVKDWSDALERRLIAESDELLDKKIARDGSLEAWVRDRAFRQHCALFGQRPFLWHISDGLKDGFSVFIQYHRFDQANLRKLTYTLLGDWLARAKAENNALRYEKGRELQQMLEKVLEGEKPYDIFVRWKSLAQQPLGWDPDLDDGVRQNIRPFIKAGVLTQDLSKILKDKDRGTDVNSAPWHSLFKGDRRNDHHTSLAEKRSARDATK